jgi:hypothetical protein
MLKKPTYHSTTNNKTARSEANRNATRKIEEAIANFNCPSLAMSQHRSFNTEKPDGIKSFHHTPEQG